MSQFSKRTLLPRVVEEMRRIKELKKAKFFSRHEIMEEIRFPETTPARIVIKSNEKGTGFMRNHYNEEYLSGYISRKDFDEIVDKCSTIVGNEYSRKRNQDTQGMDLWIKITIALAFLLALVFLWMAYYIPDVDEDIYEVIVFILAIPSFLISIFIMLFNFCQPFQENLSFEQMVYRKVNEYLVNVNNSMKAKHLEWVLIPNHYWMEVRMTDKNEEDYDMDRPGLHNGHAEDQKLSSSHRNRDWNMDDENSKLFDQDD